MARSASPRKPRRKKVEAGSVGLQPADCVGAPPAEIAGLAKKIEAAGGAVIASYRDPLGGSWLSLAALPIASVAPTPFQRDLSESHAKRLSDSIAKLGVYLDPVIAVPADKGFWTPNGRHRLDAMTRSGAKTIVALVLPETKLQYKILALNVEKAHNLREKSLEVIRMFRGMPASDRESDHAFEFEEAPFITLGVCYERNGRFGGGAYSSILKRVDGFLDEPLSKAVKVREARAARIEKLDGVVAERVKELQAKGMKSPYLKAFVLARCNPLRFMKTVPPFDEALDDITKRTEKFSAERVKAEDVAATGGAPEGGE
jgi:ParB family chromosome partitioning protein